MVARKSGPYYKLSAFISACRSQGTVLIWPTARTEAKQYFSLFPDNLICGIIYNDKLPNFEFDNTANLQKGPPQDIGKPVDAYTFSIGNKYVYIAFYKSHKGKWIIKSFHPPKVGERTATLTHNPFSILVGDSQ